jgi:Flp pilus assembly protein TadD
MSIGFRLASCALVTLLGFLLAGCATESWLNAAASTEKPDQDGLMRVASDIESQGQIAAALPIYERAAATSSDAAAQLRLGDAYTRASKTDQAIKAYRAALALAPDNPDALLGLGSALVKAGDSDGAVVALAKVAPIVNTMTAYNRLGVAQTLAGQFAQACQSFEAASALAPDDLDIRTNLALAAALDGQETKAIAATRAVVTAPGAEARHRRNLMIVFGLLGRRQGARQGTRHDYGLTFAHQRVGASGPPRRGAGPRGTMVLAKGHAPAWCNRCHRNRNRAIRRCPCRPPWHWSRK